MLFSSLAPTNFRVAVIAGQSNILAAPGLGDSWPIPATNDRCWDWDGPLGIQQIQHLEEPHPGNDKYKPRNGSPMPSMAIGITSADPETQLLVVRSAIGGTALLDDNAVPANSWGPLGSLFPNSRNRALAAISALESAGHNVVDVFVVWSQGFADAKGGQNLSNYGEGMIALLNRYRTDLSWPTLQMYTEENYAPYGTPGVGAATLGNCETVKTEQLAAVASTEGLHIAFNEAVSVIRANGWLNSFDQLHYSQRGLNFAGEKYAEYIANDLDLGDVPYLGEPMISHMFHRFKFAPAYEPIPPPAGPVFVRNLTPGTTKTSGTTITATVPVDVPVGNVIVVSIAADNRASSGPEVTGISKPGGETNSWVFLGKTWVGAAGGSVGVVQDLFCIKTTMIWPASTVITATFDLAIAAKVMIGQEFSTVSTTIRGTPATGSVLDGLPSITLTGVQIGDLVVAGGSWETHIPPTGDADTTGGSWSAIHTASTTGGLEATNITASMQHKIATAAGSQTYNPTGNHSGGSPGSGDTGIVVAALEP